jgi:4Fe-4S ferredoxin
MSTPIRAPLSKDPCRKAPGTVVPVIDRGKCEGKADCVRVCPFDVFEVRRIDDADFAALGLLGKVKSLAHGRKSAYTPRAHQCEGCGHCVTACPEKAIRLAAPPTSRT